MLPGARKPRVNRGEQDFAFHCRSQNLPAFHQQYQFARSMGRKFTSDFCWPDYMLIVEINGGVWMAGGAHSMPSKIEGDYVKHQYAALLGYFVLPFTPQDVRSGHAIEWTMRTLYKHGWRPKDKDA